MVFVLSQKVEGSEVWEELLQYLDGCSGSDREESGEDHIEARKAADDLSDPGALITVVGGIAAVLIWEQRQTVAQESPHEEGKMTLKESG